MNTTITLKQLRNDFPAVIEAVAAGKSFTVMKRSRPVLKITAPEEEAWEFDFRDENGRGIPADLFLAEMKKYEKDVFGE
jgi:antitoxin (DNA-binding transcriptional repressor) of toxin-antitoxin stability system